MHDAIDALAEYREAKGRDWNDADALDAIVAQRADTTTPRAGIGDWIDVVAPISAYAAPYKGRRLRVTHVSPLCCYTDVAVFFHCEVRLWLRA